MYVEVALTTSTTAVCEVDDLKRLSVVLDQPGTPEAIDRALGDLGRLDGVAHAWLNITNLRRASGRADDPDWTEQFEAMIAFAGSHGWLDPEGDAVRAHLTQPGTDVEDRSI